MSEAWQAGDDSLRRQLEKWRKEIEENTGIQGPLWAHMSESVYAGLMGITVQEAHDKLVDRADAKPLEQDGWWAIEVCTAASC